MADKRFSITDLHRVTELSNRYYVDMLYRIRIDGMHRDLDHSEMLALSWYQAAATVLGSFDALNQEALSRAMPSLRTEVQEIVEDEMSSYCVNLPQKRK